MIFPMSITPRDVSVAFDMLADSGRLTRGHLLVMDVVETFMQNKTARAAVRDFTSNLVWHPISRRAALTEAPELHVRLFTAIYRRVRSISLRTEIVQAIQVIRQDPDVIRSVLSAAFDAADLRRTPKVFVMTRSACPNPTCPVHHPPHGGRYHGWGTHVGES